MPIINVDNEKLFNKLGLESQYQDLQSAGVKLVYASAGLKFSKGGKLAANAPISPTKAADIVSGKLEMPDPVAQTIKASLMAAVAKALMNQPTEAAKPQVVKLTEGPVHYFPDDPMTAERSQLKEAKFIYQPVYGTDDDSRYFAVAIGNGINIAVRLKSNKISVRVDGKTVGLYYEALNQVDLFGPVGPVVNKHLSCHYQIKSTVEGERILGSIMGVLGIFDHPAPKLGKISQLKEAA